VDQTLSADLYFVDLRFDLYFVDLRFDLHFVDPRFDHGSAIFLPCLL
jgi:hypothetical protein